MRVNVRLETHGVNLKNVMSNLVGEWRELVDNDEALLPTDSELHLSRGLDEATYTAVYTARIKIDTGEPL